VQGESDCRCKFRSRQKKNPSRSQPHNLPFLATRLPILRPGLETHSTLRLFAFIANSPLQHQKEHQFHMTRRLRSCRTRQPHWEMMPTFERERECVPFYTYWCVADANEIGRDVIIILRRYMLSNPIRLLRTDSHRCPVEKAYRWCARTSRKVIRSSHHLYKYPTQTQHDHHQSENKTAKSPHLRIKENRSHIQPLIIPPPPPSPRRNRRPIPLVLGAKIIIFVVPTTIIPAVRAILSISAGVTVVSASRLGAKAIDDALASSTDAARLTAVAAARPVVVVVSRAGLGSGM
jgi:hypothetical protein